MLRPITQSKSSSFEFCHLQKLPSSKLQANESKKSRKNKIAGGDWEFAFEGKETFFNNLESTTCVSACYVVKNWYDTQDVCLVNGDGYITKHTWMGARPNFATSCSIRHLQMITPPGRRFPVRAFHQTPDCPILRSLSTNCVASRPFSNVKEVPPKRKGNRR